MNGNVWTFMLKSMKPRDKLRVELKRTSGYMEGAREEMYSLNKGKHTFLKLGLG